MTVDIDVSAAARHFGLDPVLVQAVVRAEGDIVKAVQCSLPHVQTRAEALDILCRSCVHAMSDYVRAHAAEEFVSFWAARWAPTDVSNDPHNLNANWARNVYMLWVASALHG